VGNGIPFCVFLLVASRGILKGGLSDDGFDGTDAERRETGLLSEGTENDDKDEAEDDEEASATASGIEVAICGVIGISDEAKAGALSTEAANDCAAMDAGIGLDGASVAETANDNGSGPRTAAATKGAGSEEAGFLSRILPNEARADFRRLAAKSCAKSWAAMPFARASLNIDSRGCFWPRLRFFPETMLLPVFGV
jgi:hypothetical protein